MPTVRRVGTNFERGYCFARRHSRTADARAPRPTFRLITQQTCTRSRSRHAAQQKGGLTDLLLEVCTVPVRPITDIVPSPPAGIAQITHRALQIERNARYASVEEMLHAIRAEVPDFSLQRNMLTPAAPSEPPLAPLRKGAIGGSAATVTRYLVLGSVALVLATALAASIWALWLENRAPPSSANQTNDSTAAPESRSSVTAVTADSERPTQHEYSLWIEPQHASVAIDDRNVKSLPAGSRRGAGRVNASW